MVYPHRVVSSSHEAPYLSALMNPESDIHVPSKASGKDYTRHYEVGMITRNKKERSMEVISRNLPVAGVDGRHSHKLQKLGEVEGSFWHVRVELLGWKERLDTLFKIVDDGLGLITGLDFVSKEYNEVTIEKKRGLDGLKDSKANNRVGPDRGPLKRPVFRKDQISGGLQSKSSLRREMFQPKPAAAPMAGPSSKSGSTATGEPSGHIPATNFNKVNVVKGLLTIATPSKEHAIQAAVPMKVLSTQNRLTVEGDSPRSNTMVGLSQALLELIPILQRVSFVPLLGLNPQWLWWKSMQTEGWDRNWRLTWGHYGVEF
ncbi:uncharacterized protein LOC121243846 [Juglans microcarpa x Juglans regia]|uniref:uncharacterized protein LOC121243846 n=1 Tax=Juglans microcarpa x Juglans regia TaxID=2249226 RepID=UPI001B7DB5C5|nr:uncharacterized protein LOC121243846 [Juglans microcarpa x Juglans regia]